MGNNGEIFTNDAGQSIPNPEGYATTSEITLTREIFGDLAHNFPERFITKDNTNVPESFKLFKDKKKPIYQVIIVPILRGSGLVPSHKEESFIDLWLTPHKFLSVQVIIPLSTILDLLRGQ